jgi:hypothetical protein
MIMGTINRDLLVTVIKANKLDDNLIDLIASAKDKDGKILHILAILCQPSTPQIDPKTIESKTVIFTNKMTLLSISAIICDKSHDKTSRDILYDKADRTVNIICNFAEIMDEAALNINKKLVEIIADNNRGSDPLTLNFRGSGLHNDGVSAIVEFLTEQGPRYTGLNLEACFIGSEGVKVISDFLANSSTALTTLHIGYNSSILEPNSFKDFCGALQQSKLTELSIRGEYINNANFNILVNAIKGKITKLISLNLDNEYLHGILKSDNLGQLIKSGLKILSITNSGLDDEDVKIIAKVLQNNPNSLTRLDISGNPFSDEGLKLFAGVLTMSGLSELVISNVTNQGINYIADALKQPDNKLKVLNIRGNWVQEGIKFIADALPQNSGLKVLHISRFGDEELEYIAQALKKHPMEEIDIGGWFTAEKVINFIKGESKLQKIVIGGDRIRELEVLDIIKASRDLTIELSIWIDEQCLTEQRTQEIIKALECGPKVEFRFYGDQTAVSIEFKEKLKELTEGRLPGNSPSAVDVSVAQGTSKITGQ